MAQPNCCVIFWTASIILSFLVFGGSSPPQRPLTALGSIWVPPTACPCPPAWRAPPLHRIGPKPPAFLTPEALAVVVDKFGLKVRPGRPGARLAMQQLAMLLAPAALCTCRPAREGGCEGRLAELLRSSSWASPARNCPLPPLRPAVLMLLRPPCSPACAPLQVTDTKHPESDVMAMLANA